MKLKTTLNKLREGIRKVSRAVKKNPSLPVLSSILFVAGDDGVKMRATNLDIAIEHSLDSQIEQEGIVAIPHNVISGFITETMDGEVSLSSNGDVVNIKTGNSSSNIKTMPYEDFPELPQIGNDSSKFKIDSKDFEIASRAVINSAASNLIRPELASVYIYEDAGSMVFVTTDSFRLAEKKINVDRISPFDPILIPARNLSDIISVMNEGNLDISINEHHATISDNNTKCTTRLTTGNFPDYKQIIPESFESEATVLSRDLKEALRHVSIFSDSFSKIMVSISSKDQAIEISARNKDIGESKEIVKGSVSGDAMTINFNHRYINDIFNSINTDSVKLSFSGKAKPLLMEGVGDTTFTYIVMPMNR